MLLKNVLNVPGDYKKTLKHRLWVALGLMAVGLVGVVCYFTLLTGSDLSDHARGFYLGAACGITMGAAVLAVRTAALLLGDPEKRRVAQVKEEDERERAIADGAFRTAGLVTFFTLAAALFIAAATNYAVFRALFGMLMVYCLSFAAGCACLQRKL